jgi:hypothetical protein
MPETDGCILLAEPYPEDGELIALHLQYAESAEEAENHQFKFKRFFMRRGTAQMLSKSLSELLSAPDTESAWEQIANNPADAACCFEDEPETI